MLLKGKIDRAFKLSEEQRNAGEEKSAEKFDSKFAGDELEQMELIEKRAREKKELRSSMEKGDMFAMMLSAFLVIMPVAIGVLLVIGLLGYLFIAR